MARKNVQKVFQAWLNGKEGHGDSNRTIWTDGKTIYSYRMPLLHGDPHAADTVLCKHGSLTRTTTCQRNSLAYLMTMNKIQFKEVEGNDVDRARKNQEVTNG